MDKLKEAMNHEHFSLVDDYDNPKVILFGRNQSFGITKMTYCIGVVWDDDENYSTHHISSWKNVVKWLNENTEGGYDFYKQLYESRLQKAKHVKNQNT